MASSSSEQLSTTAPPQLQQHLQQPQLLQQQREDGLTAEELQEKAEVETSLRKHVLDLQNILNINDEILKENSDIDQNLYTKEKIYERLVEQNKEDVIQLELEKPSQLEAFAYNVSITEAKVEELRRFKIRYDEIADENESLRKTFSALSEEFSDEAKKYADEMHKLNKGMQSMRQEMENIFKKKLIDMDVRFQDQAFGNLNDRKKKELLAHSKLQDEIAMQGNGQSNLRIRISRDKTNFSSTKKNIKRLNRRASAIRSKLKEFRHVKSVKDEKLQMCNAEISALHNDSADLLKLLSSWPYLDDIEIAVSKSEKECVDISKEYSTWAQRLKDLLEIEADFRSLRIRRKKQTGTNSKGNTSNSSSSSTEDSRNVSSSFDGDHSEKLCIKDVREAMNSNPCMREIFEPLMGKENLLALCRGSTNIDKNPLAWLIKSIMDVWDIKDEVRSHEEIDNIDDNLKDHDGEERDLSEDMEDLWDSAFEVPNELSKSSSSLWLRAISSPKNFPDDVAPFEKRDMRSCVDASLKTLLNDVETVTIPSPKKESQQSIPPIRSSLEGLIGYS